MRLLPAAGKFKSRKISFEGWNLGFGELDEPIGKVMAEVLDEALRRNSAEYDNPDVCFSRKNYPEDGPLVIHLRLPLGPNLGGPTFEFTIKELVDDALSWGDDCDANDMSFVDEYELIRDELRKQADRLDRNIADRSAKLAASGSKPL